MPGAVAGDIGGVHASSDDFAFVNDDTADRGFVGLQSESRLRVCESVCRDLARGPSRRGKKSVVDKGQREHILMNQRRQRWSHAHTTYHIKRILGELHVHSPLSDDGWITEDGGRNWSWSRHRLELGRGLCGWCNLILSEAQAGEQVGDVVDLWRRAILLALVLLRRLSGGHCLRGKVRIRLVFRICGLDVEQGRGIPGREGVIIGYRGGVVVSMIVASILCVLVVDVIVARVFARVGIGLLVIGTQVSAGSCSFPLAS